MQNHLVTSGHSIYRLFSPNTDAILACSPCSPWPYFGTLGSPRSKHFTGSNAPSSVHRTWGTKHLEIQVLSLPLYHCTLAHTVLPTHPKEPDPDPGVSRVPGILVICLIVDCGVYNLSFGHSRKTPHTQYKLLAILLPDDTSCDVVQLSASFHS